MRAGNAAARADRPAPLTQLHEERWPTTAAEHDGAVLMAEARLGRRLSLGERNVDIVGLDRDLARAKDRLERLVDKEKRRAVRAHLDEGRPIRLRVTREMRDLLEVLYRAGQRHAAREIRAQGLAPAGRALGHRSLDDVEARLRHTLNEYTAVVRRKVDAMPLEGDEVGLGIGDLAATSIGERALEIPGARDVASRIVSTGLFSGIGSVFDANAGLFQGWEYSAVMDGATCDVCSEKDGTTYESWDEAQADLPDGGPNPDCDGDGRCRCRLVPTEAAPDAGAGVGPGAGGGEETAVATEDVAAGTAADLVPGADQEWTDRRAAKLRDYAARMVGDSMGPHYGMTVDEYLARIDAQLAAQLADVPVSVRTRREALQAILDDGRFKSQFETQTSGGMLAPEIRAQQEEQLFGYPADLPPERRPIYGYVSGSLAEGGAGENYGEVRVVLHATVRARTTFTMQDSLGALTVPQPIEAPTALAFDTRFAGDVLQSLAGPNGSIRRASTYYAEAQIHGGLAATEIAEVIIPRFGLSPLARINLEKARERMIELRDTVRDLDMAKVNRRIAEIDAELDPARGDPLTQRLDAAGIPWRYADNVDQP